MSDDRRGQLRFDKTDRQPSFRILPRIFVGSTKAAHAHHRCMPSGERTTKIDVLLCPHYFHALRACKSLDKNQVVEWFELDWKMHGDLDGYSFEICDKTKTTVDSRDDQPRRIKSTAACICLFVCCDMNGFVSGTSLSFLTSLTGLELLTRRNTSRGRA